MGNVEELHKTLKLIAKLHGVKLSFNNTMQGGVYWNGHITVGSKATNQQLINIFCHELAHFKNDLEGKYPVYHRMCAKKAIQRMGLQRYVNYALKAEIYTDKIGKKICKDWFPKVKYTDGYKDNEYYRGFMYGYFLPEAS